MVKKPVWERATINSRAGHMLVHKCRVLAQVWPVGNGNFWVGLFGRKATFAVRSKIAAMRVARRELKRLRDILVGAGL